MFPERTIESVTRTIQEFLLKHSLYNSNPLWEIKQSNLGGFGLFATRQITAGEVIFQDFPIALSPRTHSTVCIVCYSSENVLFCVENCGWKICARCQNSVQHSEECNFVKRLAKSSRVKAKNELVMPIRILLLDGVEKQVAHCLQAGIKRKQSEEGSLKLASAINDCNSYEVPMKDTTITGLYSLGSFLNHSCLANINIEYRQTIMVGIASKNINKGEEILHCYCRFIWGTLTRLRFLHKTKHFLCKCSRCSDTTEFGSYMSAIRCKKCTFGLVLAKNPLDIQSEWMCDKCNAQILPKQIVEESAMIASILQTRVQDVTNLNFIEAKLLSLAPVNHEVVVAFKYKVVCSLGVDVEFMLMPEQVYHFLLIKKRYCQELLDLLELLDLGMCKMKTYLLAQLDNIQQNQMGNM